MIKGLILLTLLTLGCEKPQHVARCVYRCAEVKGNCTFDATRLFQGKRYCYCVCTYGFEGNTAEWDKEAK